MKYFVLDQRGDVVDVEYYLNRPDINPEFSRFVQREAGGAALVASVGDKPAYLGRAGKLGFRWEPNADSGHVQYNYKANLMRRLVMDYARQLVHGLGLPVFEVNGANMFNAEHPVVEAYASLYGDRLYHVDSGDHRVVMSYDASYPQFNLAGQSALSYRQLPFAHFSLSDCYRYEQSGELMLLMRQRRFFMPDVHVYFLDMAEAFEWIPVLQDSIVQAGNRIGRAYHVVVEVPSERDWQENRSYIERIPRQLNADVLINILEDGKDRYWVVNVDYKILDQLGQSREIACIQLDVGNAARLNISYADKAGERQHPVIIHSAIPGGIERYLYSALDNANSPLPPWLNPVHFRLLPVNDDHVGWCRKIVARYADVLRGEIDDRSVSVGSKVRRAHEDQVARALVIGEREQADGAVVDQALNQELSAVSGMPFFPRQWPAELSRQV